MNFLLAFSIENEVRDFNCTGRCLFILNPMIDDTKCMCMILVIEFSFFIMRLLFYLFLK